MTKRQRILIGSACLLLSGGIADICYRVSQYHLFTPEVHDTVSLSPDGVYTATLHSVDTGAAGSYCQALLRKTADKDDDKTVILVDGGYRFVDKIEWDSNRKLFVTLDGPSNYTNPTSWWDIKIVYR